MSQHNTLRVSDKSSHTGKGDAGIESTRWRARAVLRALVWVLQRRRDFVRGDDGPDGVFHFERFVVKALVMGVVIACGEVQYLFVGIV